MIDYRHPKFLEDPNEYALAERLWQRRWSELVGYTPEGRSWQSSWLTTTFADGTPIRDGNPIFSALSADRRLGIRVIQLEPSSEPEFSFWIDKFAAGEPEEASELVITCVLSDEALLKTLDLFRQWIRFGEIRLEGYSRFEDLQPEGGARYA